MYDEKDRASLMGNYSMLLGNSVLENEECKTGYKKCGKLDNLGNYLCYPEDEECPINDIIFSNEIRKDLPEYNYTSYNEKYIYYTNQAIDKPVITKLKTVEKKLCSDKSRYYTEFPQFVLDKNYKYYGCQSKATESLYDDTFVPLDTILKEDLYTENKLNLLYNYRPQDEYPVQSLAAQMTLYPKYFTGFNKKCLKENGLNLEDGELFQEEDFKKIEDNISTAKTAMWVLFGFSIADIIIYFCLTGFIWAEPLNKSMLYVFDIGVLFFYLGMIIPTIIGFNSLNKIHYFPECGDSLTNEKIQYYNDSSYTRWKKALAILIILLFQLVIMAITNFIYLCRDINSHNSFNFFNPNEPEGKSDSQYEMNKKVEESKQPEVPEVPFYQTQENISPQPSNVPSISNNQLERTPTGSQSAPPVPQPLSGFPPIDHPAVVNPSPNVTPTNDAQAPSPYSNIPPTFPPSSDPNYNSQPFVSQGSIYENIPPTGEVQPQAQGPSVYSNIPPLVPPTVPPTNINSNITPSEGLSNIQSVPSSEPNEQNQLNLDYPSEPQ